MIEEQTRDRNREHRRHKEEKENMKSAGCTVDSRIALPEINKILKQRQHSKKAKKQRVTEKLNEVFVIAEINTRIHPGTMMVKL